MTRKIYSPEFKAQVTKEAIETNNTALVAKKHGLSQRTVYNWFSKEVNKKSISKIKSTKAIDKEIRDLKLENQILKDLLKKPFMSGATNRSCL